MLPGGLAPVLGVLAELLTGATYPADRVEGERDRVAERIAIARSQPGVIARTALAARRYGSHPYAVQLPDPDLVVAFDGGRAARAARGAGGPAGSTPRAGRRPRPAAAADVVAARWRLGRRRGQASRRRRHRSCARPASQLVDRPGAVQSNIRLGGPAPGRTDPDLAASGWPTWCSAATSPRGWSRTSASGAGYTYSPRSAVDHPAAGSSFLVEADVATEVTGPALLETWYELGRMALTR